MRRLTMLVAGFVLIFSAYVFAADVSSTTPAKVEPSKPVTVKMPKETKVRITGVVKEISDTMIVVERTVKGKTETMGFALDKPVEKIKAGDKVTVSYIKKEDKYIATRVTPVARKVLKKTTPKSSTPPQGAPPPPK